MKLTASIVAAGGSLASEDESAPRADYRYLFRDLTRLKPWMADSSAEERRERVLEINSALFQDKLDNETIPAAYTFLGQFVTHDLSFDTRGISFATADPGRITNFRTPRFDLDSVYRRGPVADPYMYQHGCECRFLIGRNSNGEPDLRPVHQ